MIGLGAVITACSQQPVQRVQYVEEPRMVTVTDDNGTQFLMTALLYNQMMNQGGITAVRNHYHTNRNNSQYYRPYSKANYARYATPRRTSVSPAKSSYTAGPRRDGTVIRRTVVTPTRVVTSSTKKASILSSYRSGSSSGSAYRSSTPSYRKSTSSFSSSRSSSRSRR